MIKKIMIMVTSVAMAGTIIIGCESSAKKVEDARANVQTSQENVAEANRDLNKAVKDSTDEFLKFQKESEERISKYERDIAEIKVKIANEKKDGITNYQKTVAELEQKTANLKNNLKELKEAGRDKWELFRIKFGKNMDDLGKAISNFF